MTDELIRQLMEAGLTKQQASSATAKTLTNLFMKEDDKILVAEASRQVQEMQAIVSDLRKDYYILKRKLGEISSSLSAIAGVQNEYGTITDEKARTVVALYAALLDMNHNTGASSDESVRATSYTMYAFLGGQAKREMTYQELSPSDSTRSKYPSNYR